MFSLPNDFQQSLAEAAAASKLQQDARDRILSQILEQLVRLNISLDMILDDEAPAADVLPE